MSVAEPIIDHQEVLLIIAIDLAVRPPQKDLGSLGYHGIEYMARKGVPW
jgi:hypothetical protein